MYLNLGWTVCCSPYYGIIIQKHTNSKDLWNESRIKNIFICEFSFVTNTADKKLNKYINITYVLFQQLLQNTAIVNNIFNIGSQKTIL